MQQGGWIVALGALVLACMLALSPRPAAAQEPLSVAQLQPGEDAPPVAPYVRYSKDLGAVGALSPARILTEPMRPIAGRAVHFGPPGQRTAIALGVRNAGDRAGSWILTTGRGSLSYFRLYEISGDRLELLVDGTDPAAASENLRTYQAFSTELVLEPGQEKTIVIDFLSDNSTYMPLRIETYGTFFQDRRANIAMVAGVVLGVGVLVFVNFLFFSITGHREFAWLALAQGFFVLTTIHAEGYFTIFFLADSPVLGLAIEDAIKCAFAAAMAQFARSFVRTRTLFPRRDLALRLLIAASLAVIALQTGLAFFDPALRNALHLATWLITVGVALFLPFIGFAAIRRIGPQLWPLLIGWGSLALFIVYAAIASMGVFTWLPINWHLAGPVGLFESLMVTLALGLNLEKIQADKRAADANYAQSMAERLAISESAAKLAEEKAFALATVNSQNALLHASGHDSRQVILALNSAVDVLERDDQPGSNRELAKILRSSADYLGGIAATTMSGAALVGSESGFLALSAFKGGALVEPLTMMFKAPFAAKGLSLEAEIDEGAVVISDRPMLMRALANLLSNAYHYTEAGGARIAMRAEGGLAVIEIVDTGIGMSDELVRELRDDSAPRSTAGDERRGSGSGFRSARRLIESLFGKLDVVSSGPAGTRLQITLPCACPEVSICTADELDAATPGWRVLDFDRREAFEGALGEARARGLQPAAATYDDTTITRGRLAESVAVMLVKPLCREMREHPAFARASEQV
ncbi:sensor histidine kinase [Pelagerythrobacter sp.]|uniref:sensor histidine kinase n=1 Tax=Pelagerythrobacter sp. TaxID=2800702 RepID=UPI0035B4F26C